ncbi:uncharacterized protein LOC142529930 isoform X1 [Primulina tabacum]|uniref:uncharacterized protein LOC142529930 isoform X1 n=2 Tax=Primulina tabacum TaxID=48773 RepID=UPI003F5AB983
MHITVIFPGRRILSTMGHRYIFNTPQTVETDDDQGWNHSEQPYMTMARVSASGNSSLINPVDNVAVQGGHISLHWTPAPRSSGYSPSILNGELPHYQPQAPGSSHDPFLRQSAAGNFPLPQDNYPHQSSSANLSGQMIPVADGCFSYQTIDSGRGPYKRKYPGNPPLNDRGSTSRGYDVGSSSNVHLPTDDPWEEKQNAESYNSSWGYPSPSCRVNNLSTSSNGTLRNVRSRAEEDLEIALSRTHLPSSSTHNSFFNRASDQSNPADAWSQSSNGSTMEWNQNFKLLPGNGLTCGSDSSFFCNDPNPMNAPTSHPNVSAEAGDYHNDITSNMNPVPQNVNNNLNQSTRGVRSGYGARSVPSFRASSSTFHPDHITPSDEGFQIAAKSYHPRNRRALPSVRMRNINRNGRALMSSERQRSCDDYASFHNRLEGVVISEHQTTFYGSRALFDQHRDMRLDTENMSYEELLELGERIGSVSTGLSDESIAKCLIESIYCSSDLFQDEGSCVICLDGYINMDDVGMIKVCGHDFHVGCIRKWLSMKNLCPVCKATAMDDKTKNS